MHHKGSHKQRDSHKGNILEWTVFGKSRHGMRRSPHVCTVRILKSAFLFDLGQSWSKCLSLLWPIVTYLIPFLLTYYYSLSLDLFWPCFGIKPNAEPYSSVQSFWLTRRRMSLCSSVSHYWLTRHTSRVYSSLDYCFHIHVFARLMLEKSCASHVTT